MTLGLSYAALSHVGLLRTLNEDSGYGGPRLLAIADGMGGHAAGEVASAVAISSLAVLDEDAPGPDLLAALRSAATQANDHLRDMVRADSELEGMGTTLTALLFAGTRLGMLHVGDSRCYLLRAGELGQITHDDTLVQSLVDEGRITADEASTHPQRNLITNALDGREDVLFDLSVREARAGDRYLLCSDGLTGPVGRLDTLREALEIPEPGDAAQRLVELALRGGGPDNITVVVADVVDGAPAGRAFVVGAAADTSDPSPATQPSFETGAAGLAAAAGDGRDGDGPPDGSGAGAATPPPSATPPPAGRRHAGRRLLVSLAVVALLVAAAFGSYAFLRTQWYVGVQDGQVVVFRGVPGSIAGLSLHRPHERTDLEVGAFTERTRERLAQNIDAGDRSDAEQVVANLRAELSAAPAPDQGIASEPATASPEPTAPTPTAGPVPAPS